MPCYFALSHGCRSLGGVWHLIDSRIVATMILLRVRSLRCDGRMLFQFHNVVQEIIGHSPTKVSHATNLIIHTHAAISLDFERRVVFGLFWHCYGNCHRERGDMVCIHTESQNQGNGIPWHSGQVWGLRAYSDSAFSPVFCSRELKFRDHHLKLGT